MPESDRKNVPSSPAGSEAKNSEQARSEPRSPVDAAEKPAKPLSPEEQMAAYEDALKEEDWGHQPC